LEEGVCIHFQFLVSVYASAQSYGLASGNALVDQDSNLNPTVLGTPFGGLVRCRRLILAHRSRRRDVANWHVTLLDQITDHRFGAILAQFFIHLRVAARVGVAPHLDDVSSLFDRVFCQLC